MRNLGSFQFTDDRAVERFMARCVTTEDKEFRQQGIEKYIQQSDRCLSSVGDSWKTVGKQCESELLLLHGKIKN